mmetsp:Transcript_46082/g.91002  ORF Transcript_46082/g.91002 Transcript_46082/m.91002 type:complete len:213 (+) Transcript_46082:1110-1748(+)
MPSGRTATRPWGRCGRQCAWRSWSTPLTSTRRAVSGVGKRRTRATSRAAATSSKRIGPRWRSSSRSMGTRGTWSSYCTRTIPRTMRASTRATLPRPRRMGVTTAQVALTTLGSQWEWGTRISALFAIRSARTHTQACCSAPFSVPCSVRWKRSGRRRKSGRESQRWRPSGAPQTRATALAWAFQLEKAAAEAAAAAAAPCRIVSSSPACGKN